MKFNPGFSRFFILSLAALAAGATSAGCSPAVDLDVRLRDWLGDAPGGVALVRVDKDGVSFHQAGYFGPDDARPVTPDTQWEIGSVTKVFTALLLARSEQAGRVSRADPAAKYLLPVGDPARSRLEGITLVALTTHTAGLPRLPGNLTSVSDPDPYAPYDRARLLNALRAQGPAAKPGGPTAYSNFGVALLGEALGEAWGMTYAEALTAQVLAPLGLKHTTPALAGGAEPADFAPALTGGKRSAHWTFQAMAPAGALRSSTRELALFLQACLGLRDTPLRDALAESFKPLRPTAEFPGEIGMGWFIHTGADGRRILWHNGATGGFRAYVAFSPEAGAGVAMLTNSGRAPDGFCRALLAGAAPDAKVVAVPASAERDLVGRYAFTPRMVFTIARRQEGALTAQLTGQAALPLRETATRDRFAIGGVAAEIVFERDAGGAAVALVLHQNGIEQRATRVGRGE